MNSFLASSIDTTLLSSTISWYSEKVLYLPAIELTRSSVCVRME